LLLPLVFGRELSDATLLLRIFLGFIAFLPGLFRVYIFNDIRDVEKDRLHPVKQNRPIASGAVSIPAAYVIAALLLVASMAVNALASHGSVLMGASTAVRAAQRRLQHGVKDVPLLDITVLMSGFLLRLLSTATALVDIKDFRVAVSDRCSPCRSSWVSKAQKRAHSRSSPASCKEKLVPC
jgi:4-hydroxybenzoate polyprenyltransferase